MPARCACKGRARPTGRGRWHLLALLSLTALALVSTACGSAASQRLTAVRAPSIARWVLGPRLPRVVDLTRPRRDGALVVGNSGSLQLLRASALHPFATGPGGYASPGGEEDYLALAPAQRAARGRCAFGTDTVYVLRLSNGPGVTAVDARGRARQFVSLPPGGLESGIVFDDTGRFGHRLLVTVTASSGTTVYAIDCRGGVKTVVRNAPKVEGGLAVAPASFGRFAGDLIAPDENSGRIYAISADGRSRLLADSGLPSGGDIGVESAGFVPPGFGPGWSALVADRLTPGNAHPGDGAILRIGYASLATAGVHPGDLLVGTEGGASTDAVSCARSCRVRHVADGPSIAHLEGHVVFARGS